MAKDCVIDGYPVPFATRPGAVAWNNIVGVTLDLEYDPICPGQLLYSFRQIYAKQRSPVVADLRLPEMSNELPVKRGITQFNLHLEGTPFRFRDPGIMLLSSIPEEFRQNYFRPSVISDTQINFLAEYIYSEEVYHHHCIVYVDDLRRPQVASIPIDPDILNPGDHPNLTSW